MTPGRRTLSYGSFDEMMLDVERLLEGHTTVGNWSLAQICRHLATVMRRFGRSARLNTPRPFPVGRGGAEAADL